MSCFVFALNIFDAPEADLLNTHIAIYSYVDFAIMLKFGAERLRVEVLSRMSDARHFRFEIVGSEVSNLKV